MRIKQECDEKFHGSLMGAGSFFMLISINAFIGHPLFTMALAIPFAAYCMRVGSYGTASAMDSEIKRQLDERTK